MRRFAMLAAVAAALSAGTMILPSSAEAGCYRLGETGYHWYRNCWGPRWLYPRHRVCRRGYCRYY